VYKIPYIRTQYKNSSPAYPGPYKVYNYIYTGENSEILEYEQSYNNLYMLYSTDIAQASIENLSTAEIIKKTGSAPIFSAAATNSNSTGGKTNSGSGINENVRAQLYSPADQEKATIKIMGDPDWIMSIIGIDQKIGTVPGLSSKGNTSIDIASNAVRQLYGPDYTINPYNGQVFIQIIFNIATDYQDNGLLDVGDDILFYNTDIFDPKAAGIQGLVYTVREVICSFSKGAFVQTLSLTYVPDQELLNGYRSNNNESREGFEDGGFNSADIPVQTTAGDFSGAFENQSYANDDRAGFTSIAPPRTQAEAREIFGNNSAETFTTTGAGAATGGFRNQRRPRQ
jgi:hypothetical protein